MIGGQVTVIGSVNRDVTVQVPRFPSPGETLRGSGASAGLGGKGANQAVAAARAGARTAWIGAVGHDGADVLAALEVDGIDVSGAVTVAHTHTGAAWVMVDASGENAIVIDPGANEQLLPGHVPGHLEGVVMLQHEVHAAIIAKTVEAARDAVTILNPAPYRPVAPHVLAGVDILIVNEIELAELTGHGRDLTEVDDVRRAVLALPHHTVIATLGSRGAMVRWQDHVELVPSPVVSAVDTTGAGDTFCGAFAAALSSGFEIPDAVRYAGHAAALSVTRAGAQPSIPHANQIQRSLSAAVGAARVSGDSV